jgi:hypothetical protein
MQPVARNVDHHLLQSATIAAHEQRGFAAFFTQKVGSGDS